MKPEIGDAFIVIKEFHAFPLDFKEGRVIYWTDKSRYFPVINVYCLAVSEYGNYYEISEEKFQSCLKKLNEDELIIKDILE